MLFKFSITFALTIDTPIKKTKNYIQMKRSIFTIMIVTFISASVLISCNSSADKVEKAKKEVLEANRDLDEANKEYELDMANYRKEIAAKVESNNQSILELKAKINEQKKDAKIEYKQKIADIELKNEELRLKMENYKATDKENWENFKEEFNHDMDELGQAFKNLTVKNTNK